jgi:hypothetical protein
MPREREIVALTEMVKWNKHIFFSKLFTVKYFLYVQIKGVTNGLKTSNNIQLLGKCQYNVIHEKSDI